jgi:hypothetical protein
MVAQYRSYFGEVGVIEGIEVGLAVFQIIQTVATSGDFSVQADIAQYIHENTPPAQQFFRKTIEFEIDAHHPRIGISDQEFYFRLTFEYNQNDLRNVSITELRDKSSSLYASSFNIKFSAQPYSVKNDPKAVILYRIQGRWDPVGLGDVSYEGNLYVRADGSADCDIKSERDWVKFIGFLPSTRTVTPIALPPIPPSPSFPLPQPQLRKGARGPAVRLLQQRLNRWLRAQRQPVIAEDGDFGNLTRQAVITFQRANGLAVDGVVGTQTWTALEKS